jgi:hypothetical protein
MKKNIFPFISDVTLIADIDRLLEFIRQPLSLDKFFKKFPSPLNEKLNELDFESEKFKDTEYFIIKLRNSNQIYKKLTNKDLNSLGITITDHTQLINPLIDCKKNSPNLKLKDALTNLIITNDNKNKQISINGTINSTKNVTLNHPDNKNKQLEINIFFKFLKKQILLQSNFKTISFPNANSLLAAARNELINWCYSTENIFIFGNNAAFSKKHTELDDLINALDYDPETNYLAGKLRLLNNHCLETLLNISNLDDPSVAAKKISQIIASFQSDINKTIKNFKENNPLSLKHINILYKILNTVARLMPNLIISKNTRIIFFQQYTPQNRLLVKLEKIIQPIQPNL